MAVAVGLGGCGEPPSGGAFVQTAEFGEVGSNPGQFSYPRCLDADETGLWVIDKLARVQHIDPATGRCDMGWRMPQWENGKPTGMAVWRAPDGTARLFIADTHYHRVMIYDARATGDAGASEHAGVLVGQFGEYGEGDGQFIYPTDVAVIPTADGKGVGRLYVSEYGGHDRVSVFEPAPGQSPGDERAFVFRFSFGRVGSGVGAEFNRPQSMVYLASANELVIADACNHRIGRFSLDGRALGWFAREGRGVGEVLYPYGLAALPDGTVLVSEFGGNRVQRFDPGTGQSLGVYGRGGRGEGELASPWGVAVREETVFVLDSGSNRVKGFEVPRGRRPARVTHQGQPVAAEAPGG